MAEIEARVQRLVANGRLSDAASTLGTATRDAYPELLDEVIGWQAELSLIERQHRLDEISAVEFARARRQLALKLLEILRVLKASNASASTAAAGAAPVFLSYNHDDAEAASVVRERLEAAGVHVYIDVEAMPPGAVIRDFIRGAIRSTAATVCIVSERSLLSGWVGQETVIALSAQDLWGTRRFIACCLDMRFLDPDFRLEATRRIDERLAAIESLSVQYATERIDTNDLNAEKSRLYELRNQLGSILDRLRGSLCLDIRPEAREKSCQRLVESLGPDA